jgi:hypothetical protein
MLAHLQRYSVSMALSIQHLAAAEPQYCLIFEQYGHKSPFRLTISLSVPYSKKFAI